MKAKEFAITYKDCSIISETGTSEVIGRILAYSGDGISLLIEVEPNSKFSAKINRKDISAGWKRIRDLPEVGWYQVKLVSSCNPILPPKQFNVPDDCLDCGAKGKELCKKGCVNL